MKRTIVVVFILFATFRLGANELTGSINRFISNKPENKPYVIDQEPLFSSKMLQEFYTKRNYTPAWINSKASAWIISNIPPWTTPETPVRVNSDSPAWIESDISVHINSNTLGKNGFVLLDYIRQVERHGLNPTEYHLTLIEKYIGEIIPFKPMDTEDMMKLDVLLTDAFMFLGLHLYYGRVDSEKEGESWKIQRKDPELQFNLKLEEALAYGNIANALNLLAPRYQAYWMMKENLAFFLSIANEPWPAILTDTIVKPGESSQIIPKIRKRLIKLQYPLSDSTSAKYDIDFETQLKLYQGDWGLNTDGAIGKGTLQALNTKPIKLINQLKVNMERFRWHPLKVTAKYIMVNIANYRLFMIEGADTLISMRVVVGKEYRETPVFNARMTYLVFSPTWTVPPTILKNDVIPELKKGPGYLTKKNMKILRFNGTEIAYNDINWKNISKNNFPYMVRQSPGPGNALGKVKFMFPNSNNIYIHDTPTKGTFARDDRAVSSGCIRIEKPVELAELLLSDLPEWTLVQIRNAMEQKKEQTVRLKTPVDVVLLYLTAWADGNGRVQFRKDIYGRDEMVLNALNQKPEPEKIKVIPF